ncbi:MULTISPECIES: YhcH/YjgK/YiaL family protein [Commensalibacter]|uniref:Protein YiaL n=2 Tax=Commensalibacter TaxID=1079922 RepID=W7E5Z4_9PROT|nr:MULTISPECIES: YhcH/YjgK/YiaL family protein [Commensalibacter]EUK18516.1 protein YiaL [Commensalibacter papalotli (ex Servin-Garciduenas et al. 2014)]CAI3932427.1 Beta-galactosidase [Commensalibacter papalotli (ex Botero et al. 2024)]CAI3943232.1 Beta-galactosidase [Commensalibacter papalotli (ex Botero et al. 2024)]
MILWHIDSNLPFPLPPILNRGLEFLRNLDLHQLVPGKIDIDGEKIFAEVVDTITHLKEESRPEQHQKYLDIHYLISGVEYIGTAIDTQDNPIYKPFALGKDIQFYEEVKHETFVELFPGSYVILFPHDIHRPCCCVTQPVSIRKIIVKIAVDEL